MKDKKHVICVYICSNSNGNKLIYFFKKSSMQVCISLSAKEEKKHILMECRKETGVGCPEDVMSCRSSDFLSFYLHFSYTFIQHDLQCIQAIHFYFISICVPWESNPQPFALLRQCSTTEPQEHRNTKATQTEL